MKPFLSIATLLAAFFLAACSDFDGDFTTDPSATLTFEKDTIRFDTVFTTIGSSTKRVKIYNRNSKDVRIANVRLAQGEQSLFRINVDGHYLSGTQSDIEVLAKDSIFLFCEVTVDPRDSDTPILVRDSLIFQLQSGRQQQMILEAYGQDVIILHAPSFETDATLDAARPYLIYDSLVVAPDATLTLAAGTTLCFHSGATLQVHGTLQSLGTLEQPVTLRGDRTDRMFDNLPYDLLSAQWGGIRIFPESTGTTFDYTDLHAATWGIHINEAECTILNSVIHNVDGYGIEARNALLYVANSQISNAQSGCVHLVGGATQMVHTTIAQFYPWNAWYGKALSFTNIENDTIYPLQQADFRNCLITGMTKDEIQGTKAEGDNLDAAFNVLFTGCLVNIDLGDAHDPETAESRALFQYCVNETEPFHQKHKPTEKEANDIVWGRKNFYRFGATGYAYTFELDSLSQARGIGLTPAATAYPTDRLGRPRPATNSDAGCYQYTEPENHDN